LEDKIKMKKPNDLLQIPELANIDLRE